MTERIAEKDMAGESEPFLVPPGWVAAVVIDNLGPTYRLLTYADGTIRFEHRCDRGERGTIICAPVLQIGNGHALTYEPCPRPGCQQTHDVPTSVRRFFAPTVALMGFSSAREGGLTRD